MDNSIVIKNVNKFYGRKQALKDISLTINCGMLGLLGRNGSGKSTLMKLLATLLTKQSGEINVCGIPIENVREIRKITGYLPQDFSMYRTMSIDEAMDYLGALSGMDKKMRKERTDELLERVNLTEHRKSKIKSLSGGIRQRLGIAQSLLHNPKVLIIDEPTSGLDPEERIRFRGLLRETAENRIVIMSTHIVDDIESFCDSIAILNDGELLWSGAVSKLLENARQKELSNLEDAYMSCLNIDKSQKKGGGDNVL